MPTHYSDAQTEHQLAQRALFKAMVGFARRARVVLRQGLKTASFNAHITEYNYFMRINKGCFAIVDGGLEVDYENLIMADGPVASVAFGAPRLLDDTTINYQINGEGWVYAQYPPEGTPVSEGMTIELYLE